MVEESESAIDALVEIGFLQIRLVEAGEIAQAGYHSGNCIDG